MSTAGNIIGNVDAFSLDTIRGWACALDSRNPVTIEIKLNGRKLGTVKAKKFRDDLRSIRDDGCFGFEIYLNISRYGLNRYLPKSTQLSVYVQENGAILNNGVAHFVGERRDDLTDFTNDYGAKYYLNKGVAVVPFSERTPEWKQSVIRLYKQLYSDSLKLGYEVFMMYGPLLGAVREKTFIQHDNDFDCAVVCKGTDIFSVTREFITYLNIMSTMGYYYTLDTNGQAHIGHKDFLLDNDLERHRSHQGLNVVLDLFLSWFQNDKFCLTFTIKEGIERNEMFPLEPIELEGEMLPSIRNPNKVLELIYGPEWATPDPTFVWDRDKNVTDFFLPIHNYEINKNIDYWHKYYLDKNVTPQFPSQFAVFLLGYLGENLKDRFNIIEFGCGNGRDSFFFAKSGIKVIATDFEDHIITNNTKVAATESISDVIQFQKTNVASMADLAHLHLFTHNFDPVKNVLYYSRFFIHAIDFAAQVSLLRFCADVMKEGDIGAFEFRTDIDSAGSKLTENHYRRFVNPDAFIHALNNNGLRVLYSVSGYGYANYLNDDAHVARILFCK